MVAYGEPIDTNDAASGYQWRRYAYTAVASHLGLVVGLVGFRFVYRPRSLVVVLMAVKEEVDTILEEEVLQAVLAFAYCSGSRVAVTIARTVNRTVTMHNDPWHVGTVGLSLDEVLLNPSKLLLHGAIVVTLALDAEV
jgi:hypothetical protein